MDKKVLHSTLIWSAIWALIFLFVLLNILVQNKLYWENAMAQAEAAEFSMLSAALPPAIAFLEEHHQPELIRQALSANFGRFQIIYTDLAGKILFSSQPEGARGQFAAGRLDQYNFSYVYKQPAPGQEAPGTSLPPKGESEAYGKLYLIPKERLSLLQTFWSRQNWRQVWRGEAVSGQFLTIFSYLFLLLGFGLICFSAARLQYRSLEARERQYASELEALKSRNEAVEMQVAQLDDALGQALKARDAAHKFLERLEARHHDETTKTARYEKELKKAQQSYDQALQEYAALETERNMIAAERRVLEVRLEEAEKALPSDLQILRFRRMLYFTWPHLLFSSKAARQMDKIYFRAAPQKKAICHVLSLLESYGLDQARLKENGVEVKTWLEHDKKRPRIMELKLPPSRIYLHLEGERLCVAFIDAHKTDRTQNDFEKFLATWVPCE